MEEQNIWIDQLRIMQSNIVTLFQGLIKERNDFKEGNDFLAASLKQMINKIDNLEKQNEMLRKCNMSLRNVFGVGLKTFKKLDLSCVNSIRDNKVSLELLQKLFLESSEKIEVNSQFTQKVQLSSGEEKNIESNTIKIEVDCGKSQIKNFGFKNSSATALVKCENVAEGNERVLPVELNKSEEILRDVLGKNSHSLEDVKRRIMHQTDESNSEQVDTTTCQAVESPIQINGNDKGSPVFKDARRQDSARTEDCRTSKSKLINEKFIEKPVQLFISPWKPQQADGSSTSKGQFTPKRAKNDSKFNSPNRSPTTPSRKSSSKETESGSSGGKKLTQTVLNIDCFKQRSPVTTKNFKNVEDGNVNKRSRLDNAEDDDIILDSPNRKQEALENKRDEVQTENETRGLDETFISSPAIRRFNLGQNNALEEIMRNQPTEKRPREKSPEYNSVPFVYKREPVRKREERMKLPGHPCVECDKYYKNVLGDVDPKDLEKILNKCSRHRDKNPPPLDETPPGYWKPYLTCTSVYSPNKDDAR